MTPNPSTIGRLAPGQRWSVGRKREVVLRLLRGESMELLSRELGVPIYKLEQWREKADAALDGALKERESDPASGELAAAMQRIGELSMEVELLRARIGRPGPLPAGGRGDGRGDVPDHRPPLWRDPGLPDLGPAALLLLCRAPPPPASPSARRGPKPSIGDEALLAAIHADLERSPWTGEGHRRSGPGCVRSMACGSRKRLLRLMREHGLLSPHRARTAPTRRTIGGSSPRRRT